MAYLLDFLFVALLEVVNLDRPLLSLLDLLPSLRLLLFQQRDTIRQQLRILLDSIRKVIRYMKNMVTPCDVSSSQRETRQCDHLGHRRRSGLHCPGPAN